MMLAAGGIVYYIGETTFDLFQQTVLCAEAASEPASWFHRYVLRFVPSRVVAVACGMEDPLLLFYSIFTLFWGMSTFDRKLLQVLTNYWLFSNGVFDLLATTKRQLGSRVGRMEYVTIHDSNAPRIQGPSW
jgi:hypothetical protein